MTTLSIDPAITDGYPEVHIAVLVVSGLDGHGDWDDAERALRRLEIETADGSWIPADETAAPIAGWHAVYRRFGTNPRRVRPSVDALCRRLARNGRLPRV